MLLFAKIMGIVCSIAVPAGVCGTQALLAKKTQSNHKKEIEAEFKKTNESLTEATKNYQTQIDRIKVEKNNLADTKAALTYNPVVISTNIQALAAAKTAYDTHHSQLQNDIKTAISTHDNSLSQKKTEIETLWKNEKTRVEAINTALTSSIDTAKNKNKTLTSEINNLKDEIEKTINDAFYTAPALP